MRRLLCLATFAAMCSACGSSSPTAPTPPVAIPPPVVVVPPVITPPPVVTPPPNPLLSDPRFSLSFYRQFVHNAFESPNALQPLRRHSEAPRIYLRTIDDAGGPIDPVTLNITAAALESTAGSLTGVFGVAGIERGTETRQGQRGWITVRWDAGPNPNYCGFANVGGDLIQLAPKSRGCRCTGNPAAINMATVKHELGHALGYWHTDNMYDLMYGRENFGECDKNPSDREIFHARVAYSRPVGSFDP